MIDAAKQYTYGGSEFRVYSTHTGISGAIHGAFKYVDGPWISICVVESELIEIKPERTVWVNIYAGSAVWHATKELADVHRAMGCVTCKKVTYRDGEGL